MALLHAIAGPLQGAVFQLQMEDVSVGRLSSNQLCVGDPSVSRQHCLVQPRAGRFYIRDLGSNNGTFVNGKRVNECLLDHGDQIRIGDTVFVFTLPGEGIAGQLLNLPDNGVVPVTSVERPVSEDTKTAIQNWFAAAGDGDESLAPAKVFLKIGAALNTFEEPETLQIELLKLILELAPAEQAAIVLPAHGTSTEAKVTGWDRRSGEARTVPVSRTLITKAVHDLLATFSDDVTLHHELSHISSLTSRRVISVIVVPLVTEGRAIGAIYLDSADPAKRLNREHLELTAVIAEYAGPTLERVVRLSELKEENRRLQTALQLKHDLIGCSPAMRDVSERIARIARTDATAMIRGKTGTGKELAARAIHQNSARAAQPFEAINCSLLRDTLLESELFGHEKGSFTGAIAQKKGKLELADGGTLFLDELAELGESQQAMLLRVLQTREFQRLGGTRTLRVDIRIIAATNKDLEESVRNKTFREDLYYRLNVVSMTMPALRQRPEDIPLLADHFVELCSKKNKRLVTSVAAETLGLLMRYDWPGNVRELENAIEYAVVFGSTVTILPEDLPDSVIGSDRMALDHGYREAVRAAKRDIIQSALKQASGNYGKAAQHLRIHVNNLHRLIRELGLRSAHTSGRPSSQ